MRSKATGDIKEKWIDINYDYMPKYCKRCKLQGHDEEECYVIHPELYPKKEKDGEKKESQEELPTKDKEHIGTAAAGVPAEPIKQVEAQFQIQRGGGRGANNKRIVSHWNAIRDNRVINVENKFDALEHEDNNKQDKEGNKEDKENQKDKQVVNTKEWVVETFKEHPKVVDTSKGESGDKQPKETTKDSTICSKISSHSGGDIDILVDGGNDTVGKETNNNILEERDKDKQDEGGEQHGNIDTQQQPLSSSTEDTVEHVQVEGDTASHTINTTEDQHEEEDISKNIQEVAKEANLSPKHSKTMQNSSKKTKLPRGKVSQITTRSSSARSSPSK